jgi:hypothetical protein
MRHITIPAVSFYEEIALIQEYPGSAVTPGMVKVEVYRCDAAGGRLPGPPTSYSIEGDLYALLVGDGQGWADEGKPLGTYRNDDLWYFIDLLRNAA